MSERTELLPNKRREPRFALEPRLALGILRDARPEIPAQLVNVRRSGATILSDVLLGDRGGLLVLDLPDRSTLDRAPVPCELCWVLAEQDALSARWLHGTRFCRIDAKARRLINALVHDARGAQTRIRDG